MIRQIAAVTYRRRQGMRWGKAMLRYMRRHSQYPWWRSQGALSLDNTAMQAELREMYERYKEAIVRKSETPACRDGKPGSASAEGDGVIPICVVR